MSAPSNAADKIDRVLAGVVREIRATTRGDAVFEHGPSLLEFAFTSACNLRCPMCSQAENPPVVRADPAKAATFLEAALPSVTAWVPSATSEPLLNDLDAMIDLCRRHRVFLDLITNVVLLTPAVLDRLVPHLHRLTLSLDACVPEVFETVRYPAKWAKTLPHVEYAFRRMRDEGVACVVHAVLMRETAPHLPALVDFIADRGGCELTILEQLPNTSDHAEHDAARLGDEAVARILDDTEARARARGVNLTLRIPGPRGGRRKVADPPLRANEALVVDALQAKLAAQHDGYCPQVGHYLKVEPDGEAFPCCRGPRDLRLGNVFTDGLPAVWNGPPARTLREAMAAGRYPDVCRDCTVRLEAGASPA
jgi:radical SAM protein with 4Fe4S-binding SPASM domain